MISETATIAGNLERVLAQISTSCLQAGRAVSSITLVVATKGRSIAQIAVAAQVLAKAPCAWAIGENYVQELQEKFESIKLLAPIHFIGRLQSNKIPQLKNLVQLVHSVATERHVVAMGDHAPGVPYMLQVNVSHDPAKAGFKPQELTAQLVAGSAGLMTMLDQDLTPNQVSDCFGALRQLRDSLQPQGSQPLALSMGMSSDYPLALQQGATHVRVGSAIFDGGN